MDVIIAVLTTLLMYLQNERVQRGKIENEAIQAFINALDKTTDYVQKPETESNRETELELSRLWSIAGRKMQQLDPNLAKIFSKKSDYWVATKKLSRKDILENRMALWQVREALTKIIAGR